MKIRILLADHHALIRECLGSILDQVPDFEVVAQTGAGREAVELVRRLAPDVVIMDTSMKDLDGVEATRSIVRESPHVKVLLLSMDPGKRHALEALKAGAAGYALKSSLSVEIIWAIRTVAEGGTFISEELKLPVGTQLPGEHPAGMLTERERQILVLLAGGQKINDIAASLEISPKTAETHRSHLMKKLNLGNIAELTRYAIREGLLQLD